MSRLPKIISLLFLWGAVGAIIIYIDPTLLKDVLIRGAYLPFFVLLFLTIWYTLGLVLHSIGKSLLLTTTIVVGLVLSALKLMNTEILIVLGLTLGIESWYIYRSNEKNKPDDEPKD
jgi:apolipoprotein N-acyltransferase